MRLTIACPEGLTTDANHLAMALGQGVADMQSFRGAMWRDAQGALYACASFETDEDWLSKAGCVSKAVEIFRQRSPSVLIWA